MPEPRQKRKHLYDFLNEDITVTEPRWWLWTMLLCTYVAAATGIVEIIDAIVRWLW